jgi:hypothetical protein
VGLQVDSYSGYKADERPVRFTLRGRQYRVEEVVDRWYSPEASWFRVRADDGNLYVLRHANDPLVDTWTLEAFLKP